MGGIESREEDKIASNFNLTSWDVKTCLNQISGADRKQT